MEVAKAVEKLNAKTGEPQGLQLLRKQALKKFETLGWPSKKEEAWKYSPLSRLNPSFSFQNLNLEQKPLGLPPLEDLRKKWSSSEFSLILFFNGAQIHMDLDLKSEIETCSLEEALAKELFVVPPMETLTDSLEVLNYTNLRSGVFIKIPERKILRKPIHCLHLFSGDADHSVYQMRTHIVCENSSTAQWIESYASLNNDHFTWANGTTHLNIKEKAHFTFIQWSEISEKFQLTQKLNIELANEAYLHCMQGSLSSGWGRTAINSFVRGTQAHVVAHAINLTKGNGISELISKFQFQQEHNKIEQHAKNLLLDSSKGVFNGCIHIEQKAQKTEASQLHQSLLLSEACEIDTKPELEIFADDVKAKHGATVGQLNPEELFYFQSRGINKERARTLLCTAFLKDLCDHLSPLELQSFLKNRIEDYWKQEIL